MTEREILSAFLGQQVLIVGDVMLDEYVWGEVRRISPEAPVPIVEAQRRTYAPGGAANVATNVAGMDGRALLGGVIGTDEQAIQLQHVLTESGVLTTGLMLDAHRPTTTKTRIVAHSQQIARVDYERRDPLPPAVENALMQWTQQHLASAGACVLSDYNKGVISPRFAQSLIGLAREQGKPVIVDPKGTDYTKYRGATVITPNIHEAERAVNIEIVGEDDLTRVSRLLLNVLKESAVLLTRGAKGMSLFTQDAAPVHIPTVARNVYDVTGAGDTVVSTLALALAVGAPLEIAACLANRAAGIVVGKLGTVRVTRDELAQESSLGN